MLLILKLFRMNSGGTFTNMSKDTNLEAISIGNRSTQSKSMKRAANYSPKEDIQLYMSWENTGCSPIDGNEQLEKSYWKRIDEHYHANKSLEFDKKSCLLEHHWGKGSIKNFRQCL